MSVGLAELRGVRRSCGPHFRLELDDLLIHPGERLVLLGPTGAGKSTLLALLAGLAPADAGRIEFEGAAVAPGVTLLAHRRHFTLVAQRPLLLSGTVRQNVEFGPRLRGAVDARAIDDLLALFQLTALAGRRAQELSGGETQLVALARALATRPRLLLLDEPTASLDPARVALVERVLCELQSSSGMSVVWATHNLFQARRIANRVALLLDGRLVELAVAEELFDRPQDPRTADFLAGRYIC